MSIFMTWDKKPFLAGTYFPVRSRYGMPGFIDLLNEISGRWNISRRKLLDSADRIIAHLQQRIPGYSLTILTVYMEDSAMLPSFPQLIIFCF